MAGAQRLRLVGRGVECGILDQLVTAVRAGQSRALVVHGAPGVGKTALLDYLAESADGCRVARAGGAQSEMELPYAGLQQLCAPMLDHAEALPPPQRDALRIALGVSAGPAPDRFLVGLAVLSLLSQVAEAQPLFCLVDDEQWLDRASAQVLAFVGRRLGAESLAVVVASRAPGEFGLPELTVGGLRDADARRLLDGVLPGPLDARVRDQLVAETRGNPLALLELPRGLTPAELAGGFGLPGAVPLEGSIEESFQRRLSVLPPASRLLLMLAAADASGDPSLVWRAAERLGIGTDAAAPAVEAGLVEFGVRVRFRHPLVRSAAYRSLTEAERQRVHRALADVIDPASDPDRRAWHRAQATDGPDDDVAAELEQSAGRARARGGLAAAAAFLSRATALTRDPKLRPDRALVAARTSAQAGAFDAARELLLVAEAGPCTEWQRADIDLVRAQLAFITRRGSDAPALLLKAAARLERVDPGLARTTYLDALSAAIFAGRFAGPGSGILDVARAAGAAPPPVTDRAPDRLLDGMTAHYNEGYAAGVPALRVAVGTYGSGMSAEEELRWLWLACVVAIRVWDDERWDTLSRRYLDLARSTGTLSELPLALVARTYALLFAGDLAGAAALTDETRSVEDATGSRLAPYGPMGLAAVRGDATRTAALVAATNDDVARRGEGVGITFAGWASAVLHNGLGQYERALVAASDACSYLADHGSLLWTTVELIEAAVRSGHDDVARSAYRRLVEMTRASETDWALGIAARSQALLRSGAAAERLHQASVDHLSRTRQRFDLARAHLLYGEWLRRERRRVDARTRLRVALDMFEAMGAAAFAERARHELQTTGETAHRRHDPGEREQLTAQEAQVARLAREGLSNPEIGARLFISARTVQYHLHKVFAKLDITSRGQLAWVLPDDNR